MYHKAYRIHLVKHQLSISRAHLVWQGESCRIHYISMRGGITMPYATYKRNSQTAQTASKNCVHISTLCIYIYNYIYTYTCIQICITCTCTAACRVCKALCYWVYICVLFVGCKALFYWCSLHQSLRCPRLLLSLPTFSIWFIQYIYKNVFSSSHSQTWFNLV